jgi:hypothetical protein
LTTAGEWSGANGAATVASGNSFDLEINLNAGQTVTCNTDIRTRNLSIVAGSLTMAGATNVYIDQGSVNLGALSIAAGATLNMGSGTIQRTVTQSTTNHFASFISNGTVNFTAAVTTNVLAAGSVTFNGTVGYTAAGNQTFVIRGASNTNAAFTNAYNNVNISGSGIKTLALATSINGDLTIAGGTLADGAFLLTGPGAASGRTLDMSAAVATAITLTNITLNPFPAFQSYNLHPTLSTVSYNGANTANVQNISAAPQYGNLTTAAGVVGFQKLFTGNTLVRGNLTTTSGFVSYETHTVTVNGNLSNAGTHNAAAAGKILLTGGGVQHQIGGIGGYGNMELQDALGALTTANATVNGNLDITTGTLTIGNFTFTQPFGKKTTVNGTLTKNAGTGLASFGELEVTVSGVYNMPTNPGVTVKGNLTNAGSFTAGTGTYTFSNTGTISSPSSLAFTTVSSNGSYINNATINVAGAFTLSTATSFTNNSIVTIGGTMTLSAIGGAFHNNDSLLVSSTAIIGGSTGATINNNNGARFHLSSASVTPAINASAATNRVRYFGGVAQAVRGGTYFNLAIDKSAGVATAAAGVIVNNDFSILNGQFADGGNAVTGNGTGKFIVSAGASYTTTRIATPWLPSNFTAANITLAPTSTVNYNGTTGHLIVQNPNGTAVTTAYGHLSFAGAVTKTVSGGDISANNLTISAGILADGGNTISVVGNLSSNGTHSGAGRILMQGTAPQLITTTAAATRPFGNIEVDNAAGVSLGGINQTFIYRIDGTLTLTDGSFNVENATLQFNGQPLAGTPALLSTTTLSNLTYTGAVAGHVVPASVADLRQLILNNASGLALSGDLNINLNLAGALTLTSGRLRLGAHDLTMVGSITTAITGGGINNMVVADGAGQLRRTMVTGSYLFPVGDESGGITVVGNPGADYSPVTLNFTANSTPRIIGVRVTDDKHPDDVTANDYISRYWSFTDSQAGVGTYTYTGTFTYSTLAPSDLVGTHATARLNSWDQNASFWTQYTTTGAAPTLTVTGATETSGPLADNDFTARVNSATVYTWLPTSGSNSWTVASNWDPQRVSPQPTDILQFTEGGNPTVTNVPIQTIGTLLVGDDGGNGPTDVTFTSTVSSTLTINNTTGTTFNIEAGSALRLSSAGTIGTLIAFTGTNVATIDGTLDLSVNTNGNNTYTATNSTTTVNGTIINGGTVNATALNLIFAANAQYEHVRNGGVVPAATRDATSVTRITGITTTNPTGLTGTFGHFVWNNTGQTTATGLLNGALNVNGRMEVAAGTLHDNGQLVTGNATVGNFFRVAANATYTTTRIATPWLPSNYTDIQLHATSTVNYNGTTGHLIVQNPNGTAVTTAYGHLSFAGAVTKTVSGGDISANNLTISAGILADGGNTISVVGNLSSNGTHSGAGRILMQGTAPQLITTTVAATRPFGNIEVDNAAGVSLGGINQTFIYRIDGTLTLTDGSFNVENATLQFNGQPLAGTPALLSTTTLSNLTYTGAVAGHVVPASVADLRQLILNNASGLALSGDLNINLNLAGALTLTSGRLRLGAHDLTMVGSITTAITGGGINNMVVADGAGQLRRTMVTGSYLFPVGDESGGITVVGNTGADYSPVTLNFTANSTPRIIGVRVTDDKHPDDVTANDYISRYWSFTDSQAGVGTYTYTGTFTYSTLAPSDLVGTHATARLNSWDQNASFWTQYTTTGAAPTLTVTGATETSGPLADNDFTARVNSATVYTWLPTSGSNSWTVAANWDPQRVSPQPTDILQFTEGGNPTVTNVPIQTIGTLLVGDDGGNGPTDVTFTSTVSSTLTINNTTGTTFNIEAGSALRLSSAGTIGTLIAFTGTNVATIDGTLELSVNTNGNNTYTATNSTTTVNGTIINGGTVNATALNLIFAANAQYEHVRNGGVVPAATRDATSVTRITGITTTNPTGLTGTFGHFVWNNTGQTTATGLLNGALNVNGRMEVAAGTLHDNGQLVTGNATVGNFFRVAANATYTTTRIATPWLPSNYTDIQLHATSTVNYNGTTGHLIVQNPNGTAVTTAYGHLSFAGAVTKTVSGGDISANNLTISAGILADGGNTISVVGNLSSNGTHSGAGRILMQGTAPQLITTTAAATRPFGNIEVDNAAGVSLGGINQTFIYRIDGTLTLTDGSFNVENATLQFNGQPLAGTPGTAVHHHALQPHLHRGRGRACGARIRGRPAAAHPQQCQRPRTQR